jgi:hypothetical protein
MLLHLLFFSINDFGYFVGFSISINANNKCWSGQETFSEMAQVYYMDKLTI